MAAVMAALVLAILEVGARIVGPVAPVLRQAERGSLLVGHPTRLWTMAIGTNRNAGPTATIAASGIREPAPAGARQGGERVVIVGDSTFFGHGVADEDTLAAQLAQRFTEAGIEGDVINGAMLGYSTEQTRVWLDEAGWDLDPTLLIVGNLWSDNNWDLFRDKDLIRTAKHYHANPMARSHLMRLLAGGLDRLAGGTGATLITWTQESAWPEERVRRVDVQRYAANLDAMVRSAAERGTGVAFIAPVNRDMLREKRVGERFSWDIYFTVMRAVAAHHGLPVIDAATPTASVVNAARESGSARPLDAAFLDKMHPTAATNRATSAWVVENLTTAGWPSDRLVGRAGTAFKADDVPADSWGNQTKDASEHASPHMRLY
ncbi:MAG: hypothetical protein VX944_03125 [Myxococcota bacterium]|nr:hypothetical protein [Myxococcota bacterium]